MRPNQNRGNMLQEQISKHHDSAIYRKLPGDQNRTPAPFQQSFDFKTQQKLSFNQPVSYHSFLADELNGANKWDKSQNSTADRGGVDISVFNELYQRG